MAKLQARVEFVGPFTIPAQIDSVGADIGARHIGVYFTVGV